MNCVGERACPNKSLSDNVRAWFDKPNTNVVKPFTLSPSKGKGQSCRKGSQGVASSSDKPSRNHRTVE